jgi:hypothetical protein
MGARANEDPLWFVGTFKAEADWIVVYWDGMTCMFFPEDPEFEAMMDAFSKGIARQVDYEADIVMSEETLEHLRAQGRLLELHYNDPVRVHTRYPFSPSRTFFVPLSETHAERQRVFAGPWDMPRTGVLNMSEEHFSALVRISEQVMARRRVIP